MSHVTGSSGTLHHGVAQLMEPYGSKRRLAHLWSISEVRCTSEMPEVHRTSGISTWQYCNALTMKLAPPSDDDRNYYTLGLVWARDVASVTSRANIPRCVLPTRWLILKRSPESVSWNKQYSHLLKIQACDYHLRISWIIFHSFRSVPGIFQVLILYPLNVFLGVLFKKKYKQRRI